MTRCTPGADRSAWWIAAICSGTAASPMIRLLVSTAYSTATVPSSAPMPSVAIPSKMPLPVSTLRPTPEQRQEQADQGAAVLQQDHREFGVAGAAHEPQPAPAARLRLASPTAVRNAYPSRPAAMSSTATATSGDSSGCGSVTLW
jgi:hypothetical protein